FDGGQARYVDADCLATPVERACRARTADLTASRAMQKVFADLQRLAPSLAYLCHRLNIDDDAMAAAWQ
ncbi:unnamed protein product, partial [Effrenium voratum]